jgi:transcriptional regulator with XRE-family HTH domain
MAGSGSLWVQPSEHKAVGACLAAARRRAKLTQQELAQHLDKPRSFVSDYERGQRRLDLLEFLLVAQALRNDPRDLFEQILQSLPLSPRAPGS